MDRKKKKKTAVKTAANIELQRKALKERFIDRTRMLVSLMGAEDLFKKVNPIYFEKLYECRYPVLKAKAAANSTIPKHRVNQFNKLMYGLMEGLELTLHNGNKIPLAWYLSEGLTLVDGMSELDAAQDPDFEFIKNHFKLYFSEGSFHRQLQQLLIDVVTETIRFLSDYNDYIYRADLEMTPYFARFNPQNDIILHAFKPERHKVDTKNGTREAIRLGWPNQEMKWQYFNVKASTLGFEVEGIDIPLELYISGHALQRLRERINITPGIMHEILFYTFLQEKIPHRRLRNESQVDYYVADQKVGYLIVKLHGNKLLVHTFLFLTNNDTFEGEKLGRLLNLEKADKKYLQIDTLPAFNSYHIDQNEELSTLFKYAGCGSLLKLGHVQEFTVNQVKDKDPDSILHYLADAPYFKKS